MGDFTSTIGGFAFCRPSGNGCVFLPAECMSKLLSLSLLSDKFDLSFLGWDGHKECHLQLKPHQHLSRVWMLSGRMGMFSFAARTSDM